MAVEDTAHRPKVDNLQSKSWYPSNRLPLGCKLLQQVTHCNIYNSYQIHISQGVGIDVSNHYTYKQSLLLFHMPDF